jgi:ribonucrease Y
VSAGIIVVVAAALIGTTIAGFVLGTIYQRKQSIGMLGTAQAQAQALVEDARRQAETARKEAAIEARDEALKLRQSAEGEVAKLRQEVEGEVRTRMAEVQRREDRLLAREEGQDSKAAALDQREAGLNDREQALDQGRRELESEAEEQRRRLEQVAAMTSAEAKAMLVKQIEEDAKRDSMALVRDLEQQAREEADRRARKIVTLAIQRVASEQTSESTVSVLPLPSDDMKGRIIGREGRNIRALEHLTGVDVIVDDTPETVVLSSFDGIRREIAKVTLQRLIEDGRIHPARIEEMYYQSKAEIDERMREAGEQAVFEANGGEFHEEIVKLLGRLHYRTSYGQNVLKHTLEVVHLAGIMAAELGANVKVAKRAAMLHDLGKALTHEVEGSHAAISTQYAKRYGESPAVVHAVEAHHYEIQPQTVEAVLLIAADAISGSRPGARGDSLENYVKRLEALEDLAGKHKGVDKVYALQAGREIRVIVRPGEIDDDQAVLLSHEIARDIEDHLEYPGQIKVTVIRESRAVEYAK